MITQEARENQGKQTCIYFITAGKRILQFSKIGQENTKQLSKEQDLRMMHILSPWWLEDYVGALKNAF